MSASAEVAEEGPAVLSATDERLIDAFRTGELPPEEFRHAEHVRMAWAYQRRWPFLEALRRFVDDLRAFADAHGAPDLYHATVTWAYLVLIRERTVRGGETDWESFAAANPDLLRWRDAALFDRYDPEILGCETARRVFVLPQLRGPGQGGADERH